MDFRLDCACGRSVVVTEGSAGARLDCACGKSIAVPSLQELRQLVGLPAYDLSPELVIDQLIASGRLPPDWHCVVCGNPTQATLDVSVECERAYVPTRRHYLWPLAIFTGLFLPVILHYWYREETGPEVGTDKRYVLPLPLCTGCRSELRSLPDVLRALRVVPEYARLLGKFPEAVIHL